jgi:hypothetical protein
VTAPAEGGDHAPTDEPNPNATGKKKKDKKAKGGKKGKGGFDSDEDDDVGLKLIVRVCTTLNPSSSPPVQPLRTTLLAVAS